MSGRVAAWLLAVCVAAPWVNPFTSGPMPGLYPLVFSWLCAAFFLLVARTRPYSAAPITDGWMIAGIVSGVIGLAQFFGYSDVFGTFVSHVQPGEAFGNLRQRNQFASLCNISLAIAVFGWRGKKRPIEVAVRFTVIALALLAGAASGSRTGLLQLACLVVVYLAWSSEKRSEKALRVLGVAMAYLFSLALLAMIDGATPKSIGIVGRISENADACHSRLTLWSNVFHLIALRPWSGWGWGEIGYAHYVTLYDGPRFCEILDNAHNLPLHLAVELGLPFAIAVCAAIGWVVWRLKPWAERDPARQLAWAVLMIIGIHSLLEYPLWYGPFQMAVLLCIYMLWPKGNPSDGEYDVAIYAKPISFVISFFLIAGCLYAAWDYRRVSQLYLPGDLRAPAYQDNTLEKVAGTRLFRYQVEFAELMTTPLNQASAPRVYVLARHVLHFSAEPSVIEKAIESSRALGFFDEANFHMDRFEAAFPKAYERWLHRT